MKKRNSVSCPDTELPQMLIDKINISSISECERKSHRGSLDEPRNKEDETRTEHIRFPKKCSQSLKIFSRKTEKSEPPLKPPNRNKERSGILKCIPKKNKVNDYGVPKNVPTNDDIVRSGHLEFQTLYATNDMETPSFVVNTLGAPNDSTLVCGCENVSCPFCNLVLSIRNRDPALDTDDLQ